MSSDGSKGVCVVIDDVDLVDDVPGPSRLEFRPSMCSQEAAWFIQDFQRPSEQVLNSEIPQECLTKFQNLIWNMPHDRMVPGYGLTPKELASISSDGRKGWLVTCHFYWLSRCLNQQQQHTRFFVLDPTIRKVSVEKLLNTKSLLNIKQLIFVLSVGRQDDGVVFLGTDKMQGDHWSVVVVDIVTGTVTYCDTLGWPAPDSLLSAVAKYTSIFGLSQANELTIRMAHKPNLEQHLCMSDCTNYPLQTCSDICGVIAMVCIATAALDKPLFELLLSPINKGMNLFLTDPTLYSSYLRHVLIFWLVNNHIDISRISLKPDFNVQAPAVKLITPIKRKLTTECNGNNHDGPKRRIKTSPNKNINLDDYILEALAAGVSSENLLSETASLFSEDQLNGAGSLSKCVSDLIFNNAIERSQEDSLSVKSYCRDLVVYPNLNPILLFKNSGKEMKMLNLEDTLVAIQTPFQKEMMKEYGKKCICIDVPRKKEEHKFTIITVLVCYEEYVELPVAYLITNRTDNKVINLFMKTLGISVGELQPQIFLGDVNFKLSKIWAEHFQKPAKVMFNPWEVLHISFNRVDSMIPTHTDRQQVKSYLRILISLLDQQAFKGYLEAFQDFIKPFEAFQTFFCSRFVNENRSEYWASSHRQLSSTSRLLFLQPHSRLLTELGFLDTHKINRLDVTMHRLLQLVRFLETKLYIQPNPARVEKTVKEIETQHSQPMGNLDIFQSASGEEWCIRASAETNGFTIMDTARTECDCGLDCSKCRVCVHRYVCSCCDYLLLAHSCKHIHILNAYKRMNSVINSSQLSSPSPVSGETSRMEED